MHLGTARTAAPETAGYQSVSDATVVDVGWDIDENGNEAPGSRIPPDNYIRNQLLPDGHKDKLPHWDRFELRPLPPILPRADDAESTSDAAGEPREP